MRYQDRDIELSFEFFPPKTEAGEQRLATLAKTLTSSFQTSFCSVTYGAGGSTQQATANTVIDLQQQLAQPVAPHISCIGSSKAGIAEMLTEYKRHGIKRLIALRGDLPSGMGGVAGEMRYAADLVAFIRERFAHDFHIEVAAYPEMHPQALNMQKDLQYFQAKMAAGADSALTQYFFNADAYYYFHDAVRKLGVEIPIVPGIMPIHNFSKLVRFSEMCGAEIPRWLSKRLQAYGDDSASVQAFAIEVVHKLCEDLLGFGVPGLHFYTLNQAEPTQTICQQLFS